MTYCSVVTVLVLVGLTKKRFGHYAILKILSLRSPSTESEPASSKSEEITEIHVLNKSSPHALCVLHEVNLGPVHTYLDNYYPILSEERFIG